LKRKKQNEMMKGKDEKMKRKRKGWKK